MTTTPTTKSTLNDGVYADFVIIDGERHGRCVRAVGIARCHGATAEGQNDCGSHR